VSNPRRILATAALGVALAGFGATAQAATNLVQNGCFQSGNFTDWTQAGNKGNTGVATGDVDGVSPTCASNTQAFLGQMGSIGSLSQDIATTPGKPYLLTFDLANLGVENAGSKTFFEAIFGGVPLFLQNGQINETPYLTQQFVVIPTSTTSTLEFDSRHDSEFWLLDNITLTGVPEPATWTTLLVGLGLLGGAFRARRQAAAVGAS
jgi:hypothetical protein